MIKVMNAKSAGSKLEKLLDDPKYIGECKIDGYRATFEDGEFYSRLGNPLGAKVPHLVKAMWWRNGVLDGELCLPSATSNSSDVTRILGSLPENAIEKQKELGKLRYVVFDVLRVGKTDLTGKSWAYRKKELMLLMNSVINSRYVEESKFYSDKRALLEYAESNGLEGIMLKNIDSLYYPDKRPENTWYKVKRSITYDVVVIGFTEGKGKYKGLIGAVEFGLYKDGTLTYCGQCGGFTDEQRMVLTKFPDNYLGKCMEISAMERTADGHFRHPVYKGFRDDKDAKDCLWMQ